MIAILSMLFLAIQIGVQPMANQKFIDPTVNHATYVVVMEAFKFFLCAFILLFRGTLLSTLKKWTLRESLTVSAVPAVIYAVQNLLMQQAYRYTDPLTFNLVSQSKVLFSALLLYLFLGKPQSGPQILALVMITTAAILATLPDSALVPTTQTQSESSFSQGVLPLIAACFLSGVSATVSQKALQGHQRDSFLFTMELGVYGSIAIVFDLLAKHQGLSFTKVETVSLDGWSFETFVPMTLSALGGICVGLVTKYAGAVQKGISVVTGICLTACIQSIATENTIGSRHVVALVLIGVGSLLHGKCPPKQQPQPQQHSKDNKKKIS
eukprot:c2915_g1_i1.p1 GENE.c2915_g1_i1~~c2915_g1_i1.p1  ORF type:complete len:338 (-),score=72.80 c2915_g1_i1:274-1245(-)